MTNLENMTDLEINEAYALSDNQYKQFSWVLRAPASGIDIMSLNDRTAANLVNRELIERKDGKYIVTRTGYRVAKAKMMYF
jgi:hypothetical protein